MVHVVCGLYVGVLQLEPPVESELQLATSLLYGNVEIYVKEGDQYVFRCLIVCCTSL